jgi:hypothetical protein
MAQPSASRFIVAASWDGTLKPRGLPRKSPTAAPTLTPTPPPINLIRLGMSGARKPVDVPSTVAREEFTVHEFIRNTLPPEQLKLIAIHLLNSEELPRRVWGLQKDDKIRFLNRVYQVRLVAGSGHFLIVQVSLWE